MENKDVNIILKLNTNLIIITLVVVFILSIFVFCTCYNLPIFKKMRMLLKRELMKSDVEPFSLKDITKAPKDALNDLHSLILTHGSKNKNLKGHDEDENKETETTNKSVPTKSIRKPVVEGFFTNVGPN